MSSLTNGRFGIAILGISALALLTGAQRPKSAPAVAPVSHTASEIRVWREANEMRVMDELRALLEIPNFASDTGNIRRNAEKLEEMLHARGLKHNYWRSTGADRLCFRKLETLWREAHHYFLHALRRPAR